MNDGGSGRVIPGNHDYIPLRLPILALCLKEHIDRATLSHRPRAILHASPGYSLSGMYLAPATDPCYTTRAIRDGRSFSSAIHASRYRAPPLSSSPSPPRFLIFPGNLRLRDQK